MSEGHNSGSVMSLQTEYCKTCAECQLTSGRGVAQAHLHSLPIIDTPFERIGMDIVGPLDRSRNGNRYILVICDYTTKYPEVFPLKNLGRLLTASCSYSHEWVCLGKYSQTREQTSFQIF